MFVPAQIVFSLSMHKETKLSSIIPFVFLLNTVSKSLLKLTSPLDVAIHMFLFLSCLIFRILFEGSLLFLVLYSLQEPSWTTIRPLVVPIYFLFSIISTHKTLFVGKRNYIFGCNRKHTYWKGTNWTNYKLNNPNSLSSSFSLKEGVLIKRSKAFLNCVHSELVSVTGH